MEIAKAIVALVCHRLTFRPSEKNLALSLLSIADFLSKEATAGLLEELDRDTPEWRRLLLTRWNNSYYVWGESFIYPPHLYDILAKVERELGYSQGDLTEQVLRRGLEELYERKQLFTHPEIVVEDVMRRN